MNCGLENFQAKVDNYHIPMIFKSLVIKITKDFTLVYARKRIYLSVFRI